VATTLRQRPVTRRVTPEEMLGSIVNGGKLLRGRMLTCPGCERVSDILDYVPLEHSQKYAEEVVVPLKCRGCHHVFALRP